jgi:hypothetical protein
MICMAVLYLRITPGYLYQYGHSPIYAIYGCAVSDLNTIFKT